MKKKAIVLLIMLGMVMQVSAFAMPEIPGTLDRIFTEEHTMYYVNVTDNEIPDITGTGYETLKKATKIYKEGEALTNENTTIIKNTSTGKKYRFVFTNESENLEISNVSIDNSGVLKVEGKIDKEGILKMFIFKPSSDDLDVSYTWDDVDESDMTQTVLDVVEFRAAGEGTQVTYSLPQTAGSGSYGIFITGDNLGKDYYNPGVYYASKSDLDKALEGFNEIAKLEASSENSKKLAAYIKQNSKLLYIDSEYFDKQLSEEAQLKACKEMFDENGYKTVDELQERFYKSVVTAWCTDGKNAEEILAAYKDNGTPKLYKEYCDLKSRTLVNNSIAMAKDNAEFEQIFNRMTSVSMINEAPAPAEIDAIFAKYMQYFGFSQAALDKYQNNKNVSARIMLGRPFTSASEIERIILSTEADKAPSGGGGGGGGGSTSHAGGTTGGNRVYAPEINAELEPDSEIKPADGFVFKDCENYEWAKTAIKHLYDNKIINGKGENHFAPQDNITREEFVKIIVNAFDFMGRSKTVFDDVNSSEWYAEPISTALYVGIINGISDTEFGVGMNITREDMAVIIYRAVNASGMKLDIEIDEKAELADLDTVSDYAAEAVNFLIEKGAINGSEGKFNPKSNATRAEAAQMIYQVIKIR
ncbi:MAG: S-layer homology domain-containing protein [Clostridia bacterium]|nr:S-layer homology domain-containing protein [Clostridia bacterium]